MHTQVAMLGRAIQTQINPKGHRSPGWILGAAVKTYLSPTSLSVHLARMRGITHLVCRLALELLKDLV